MKNLALSLTLLLLHSLATANQCNNATDQLDGNYPTWGSKLADENGYYNEAAVALMSDCKQYAESAYKASLVPSIIDHTIVQCDQSSNQMSWVYLADCYKKAAKLAAALMPN